MAHLNRLEKSYIMIERTINLSKIDIFCRTDFSYFLIKFTPTKAFKPLRHQFQCVKVLEIIKHLKERKQYKSNYENSR